MEDLASLYPEIPRAIKRGLDFAMQLVIAHIQLDQLSGDGPFPPDEHRLGTRSEQLRNALHATPAVVRGQSVTVEVVDDVFYSGIHEYGKVITTPPGKAMRFQIDGKWIVTQKVTIPARSPIRFGLSRPDLQQIISENISDEVSGTIDKLQRNA